MAVYTYNQFRKVLRHLGFEIISKGIHENWRKVLADGTVLRVSISHKHGKDIPRGTFHAMLKQAGLSEQEFVKIL